MCIYIYAVYFQPVVGPDDSRLDFFHSVLTKHENQQTTIAGVTLDEARRALVGRSSNAGDLFQQLSSAFEKAGRRDSAGNEQYQESDSHSTRGVVVIEGSMSKSYL